MSQQADSVPESAGGRRSFLERCSGWWMALGLAGGYGAFAALIGRFLYPSRPTSKRWQFVATLAEFPPGRSLTYTSPAGEKVVVTRLADGEFIAMSSVCPHLGCQVHWEPQNDRFFCPCHAGAFDPLGNPIAGPPKDADQPLTRYPLKTESGLLYVEVGLETLVDARSPDAAERTA